MSERKGRAISNVDEMFALEYLRNGCNALQAYKATHPKASTRTAGVEGCKLLKKPSIITFIEQQTAERKRRLTMDGDEALEAITRHARGHIRRLYKDGRLLPISEWPDDIADCVKGIKPGRNGTSILLHDSLKARELMAIAGGRLRQQVDHLVKFDHAAYLGAAPPEGDDE